MEKGKNHLKFSSNQSSVLIIFSDDSESIYYDFKEDVFEALIDLAKKQKINISELKEMRDEVICSRLPWKKELSLSQSYFTPDIEIIISAETGKMIEEAFLFVCPSCGKHGIIIFKRGITTSFNSKWEAREILAELKSSHEIFETEFVKLEKEIRKSTLPEIALDETKLN